MASTDEDQDICCFSCFGGGEDEGSPSAAVDAGAVQTVSEAPISTPPVTTSSMQEAVVNQDVNLSIAAPSLSDIQKAVEEKLDLPDVDVLLEEAEKKVEEFSGEQVAEDLQEVAETIQDIAEDQEQNNEDEKQEKEEQREEREYKPEEVPQTGPHWIKKEGYDVQSALNSFAAKHGAEAANIVKELYERHRMADPTSHPTEPYYEIFAESWKPYEVSRDLQGESSVKRLSEILKGSGQLFEDPTFPSNAFALYADPSYAGMNTGDAFLAGVEGIEWKRPNEIGDPSLKPKVWSGGIDPDDVAQGRLGNCYYLAAISACSIGSSDILLHDLCIEDGMDQGMFGVKFFLNGKWVTVLIDDRFPCVRRGSLWYPIFCGFKDHSGQEVNTKELWPLVFEKAWAKLHLSYEATAGGLTADTTNYLTGGTVQSISLDEPDKAWSIAFAALYPDESGKDNSCFLSCSVRSDAPGNPQSMGLVDGHAYSVLKMAEVAAGRFVQIRNPWGEFEWNGRYSDKSELWTPELKSQLDHEDEEDGSFWMCWEDFVAWYSEIDICDPVTLSKMSNASKCHVVGFASHWIAGKTAGGPPKCRTFAFNPRVSLRVQEDCEAIFSLYLPDSRPLFRPNQTASHKNLCTLSIIELSSQQTGPDARQVLTCSLRHGSGRFLVEAGKEYHLVASCWTNGVQSPFWITVSAPGAQLSPVPTDPVLAEEAELMADKGFTAFCCIDCRADLSSYYMGDDGPRCPNCHEIANPPTCCFACGQRVQGQYYPDVDNQGPCCLDCYQKLPSKICFSCQRPVGNKYIPDYEGQGACCIDCYQALNPPKVCKQCHFEISGSYFDTPEGPLCPGCCGSP
ncbi:hypothetical protein GUITHDRAFT_120920 [Guillardia theta CCMP2712]|uniref:Calpain catalytic domain-containing protein n=1 Tax=Guillardia theta (strain CCMP2712) TaxID=905079 RepID=L1I9H5_GUITC|nr:hypothetical protein GUITHDRAFT_120920 [Guillardia theta CCMP2712]EKX32896.1 hypothetical protein GUITHDRAFT_120920 [Guillardia theta CCMP2712]|eukprot:XP_005819876.1 hypothetical protein GUITHDRAFT_120920 [Guillardia theta CCMP2712]